MSKKHCKDTAPPQAETKQVQETEEIIRIRTGGSGPVYSLTDLLPCEPIASAMTWSEPCIASAMRRSELLFPYILHPSIPNGAIVPQTARPIGIRPKWKNGVLRFGEVVCCKVRKGTKIALILDAFEVTGWESRVDSPFPRGKLKPHLDNLRKKLKTSPVEIYGNDTDGGLRWCRR